MKLAGSWVDKTATVKLGTGMVTESTFMAAHGANDMPLVERVGRVCPGDSKRTPP